MTRRAKHLTISYLIVLAGVAILLLQPTHQPSYRDKPLRYWLRQYLVAAQTDNLNDAWEAHSAVQAIGTNGIPFLLEMLRKDSLRSKVELQLAKRPNRFTAPILNRFNPLDDPQAQAMAGFEMLGREAESALPELHRIIKGPPARGDSPFAQGYATRAVDLIIAPRPRHDIDAR